MCNSQYVTALRDLYLAMLASRNRMGYALRTVAFIVTLASSSHVGAQQASTNGAPLKPCPAISGDTTHWEHTTSVVAGVSFDRPRRYVAKNWGDVNWPGADRSAEWWRDNSPGWTIELAKLPVEATRHYHAQEGSTVSYCALETRSGIVRAILDRESRFRGPAANKDSIYLTSVLYPAQSGQVVRLSAVSLDADGQREQLLIARSVQVLSTP